MTTKLKILGINGSASEGSSNHSILRSCAEIGHALLDFEFLDDLSVLPHFRTALTNENTPNSVLEFRSKIALADGVLFCTPEYVFSIPSGLKNALEWCVSTTVFSGKPIGIITASASGLKGHQELQMIMKTIEARLVDDTTLLIQGAKGKVNQEGEILDRDLMNDLRVFMQSFSKLMSQ